MTSWTALAKLAQESGPEARRHPRFKARAMLVDRGEVMDFSATGIRIRFRKMPRYEVGQTVELCLMSPQGERRCLAEVVRINKVGRKQVDVGFRFPDEKTAQAMELFRAAWDPLEDGEWWNR